jgi:hypothetical protein
MSPEPDNSERRRSLLPGDVLHGYCYGRFTRAVEHGPWHVEAVGADWVVARNDGDQEPYIATGEGIHDELWPFRDPTHER